MLTPTERTLVLSMRGSPASLGFVDTRSVDTPTPLVQLIPIAGTGTFGDLAVMTPNGHYVFATYDRGLPPNKGGVVVVDVRTRQIVNRWDTPARAARTGSGIRRRLRASSPIRGVGDSFVTRLLTGAQEKVAPPSQTSNNS